MRIQQTVNLKLASCLAAEITVYLMETADPDDTNVSIDDLMNVQRKKDDPTWERSTGSEMIDYLKMSLVYKEEDPQSQRILAIAYAVFKEIEQELPQIIKKEIRLWDTFIFDITDSEGRIIKDSGLNSVVEKHKEVFRRMPRDYRIALCTGNKNNRLSFSIRGSEQRTKRRNSCTAQELEERVLTAGYYSSPWVGEDCL